MTGVGASLPGDLRVLMGARWKAMGNGLRLALRTARLRVGIALFVGLTFWLGLFVLFYGGFRFFNDFARFNGLIEFKAQVLAHLLGLFFATLMVLLVFSNAVIAYLGLYRSNETAFLLTNPLPASSVFAYKFVESLVFSSWAFLLLGTPLMLAYGLANAVPWYFYVTFFLFFIPFVVIPATVGAAASVMLAAYVPRTRLGWLAAGVVAALAAALVVLVLAWRPGNETATTAAWMRWFFVRLRFTQGPLLPSYWITQGLLAAGKGAVDRVIFYLLVLLSNALFAGLVAYALAGVLYTRGWHRAQSGSRRRRRVSRRWLDAVIDRLFFCIAPPARLLLVKDLRTFRRDPAQWSQFLIFFGILAAYIGNLRTLAYDLKAEQFRALVSLLNLSVVGMVLATFACRFVFPLMSLEGRNFWLLGLAPMPRRSVLIGKYLFAAGGSVLMGGALVAASDVLLRAPLRVVALDLAAIVLMSQGIAGISVGLGARLPNLEEDNPSKIAAGFGGTLNLVIALFYIAVVVALLAVPAHLEFSRATSAVALLPTGWLVLAAVAVTVLATLLPMRLGIRHFRRLEF
jgi:ABC-2 type transport system permease protein